MGQQRRVHSDCGEREGETTIRVTWSLRASRLKAAQCCCNGKESRVKEMIRLQWSILGMHLTQHDWKTVRFVKLIEMRRFNRLLRTLTRTKYMHVMCGVAYLYGSNGVLHEKRLKKQTGSASVPVVIENVHATLNWRSFPDAAYAAFQPSCARAGAFCSCLSEALHTEELLYRTIPHMPSFERSCHRLDGLQLLRSVMRSFPTEAFV